MVWLSLDAVGVSGRECARLGPRALGLQTEPGSSQSGGAGMLAGLVPRVRVFRSVWLALSGAVLVLCVVQSPASALGSPTNSLGGYVAPGSGTASVTFKVPKVTCPSTSPAMSIGVAVPDVGGNDVEAVVAVSCSAVSPAPSPTYEAESLAYCNNALITTPLFAVSPGNKVVTTATGSTGVATVDDLTTRKTGSQTNCPTGMNEAIYGVFCPVDWTTPASPPMGTPPCTVLPAFKNKRLHFSSATLHGTAIGKLPTPPTPWTLVAGGHMVVPGKLNKAGNAFSDTYS